MSDSLGVTNHGELREIFRTETVVAFQWTPRWNGGFPEWLSVGESYTSSKFQALGNTWRFIINLGSLDSSNVQWIGLELCKLYIQKRSVWVTILVSSTNVTAQRITNHELFPGNTWRLRIQRLTPRSEILKGGLVIYCKLWIDQSSPVEEKATVSRVFSSYQAEEQAETTNREENGTELDTKEKGNISGETQKEKESVTTDSEENDVDLDRKVDPTLQKHFRDLLLSGEDHDVVIKVQNQDFKAHKIILRARSPVFAAMFKHGMKESANGTISIDDCDPDAFGEFLNYIYTGKVDDLSPRKAMGLYYAGDKYDFSGLKEVCVQFLEVSLSTTSICGVINLATMHKEKELLEKAIKFFTENTTEILVTVEWQRFAASNFVAANELCIRAFKSLDNKKK